ncbi:uncharacterized protein LOC131634891 [Vicia villosa]|uniref:uncharacterized protein LOC131634891 n=1 Tax=Vicia villosa TaxID=3911 RepID=UPI00273BE8CF|nr:uncharacterized protein LOC131634891 [Vicia villosa]
MIRERMKVSHSRMKIYHDKRRKALKFQVGDYVFFRVTLVTGVGRALKSMKLTPHFVGPYQILEKIGEVAYRMALLPSLANLHDVFHVSQLRRYITDPSHVVHVDDVQIPMYEPDMEKKTVMTEQANYQYNVMPFGLKNATATYQRMMNKVLEEETDETLEVYMDNMIVKSGEEELHDQHLTRVL